MGAGFWRFMDRLYRLLSSVCILYVCGSFLRKWCRITFDVGAIEISYGVYHYLDLTWADDEWGGWRVAAATVYWTTAIPVLLGAGLAASVAVGLAWSALGPWARRDRPPTRLAPGGVGSSGGRGTRRAAIWRTMDRLYRLLSCACLLYLCSYALSDIHQARFGEGHVQKSYGIFHYLDLTWVDAEPGGWHVAAAKVYWTTAIPMLVGVGLVASVALGLAWSVLGPWVRRRGDARREVV